MIGLVKTLTGNSWTGRGYAGLIEKRGHREEEEKSQNQEETAEEMNKGIESRGRV